MAQFDIHGLDDLMSELNRIGQFDNVAPKMLKAGIEVLQDEVIAEASGHVDTGAMVASIKPTGMTASGDGYYICTRPTGSDRSGKRKIRNMEKLVYLEYGVRGRPATPIITKAVISAEPEVIEAMREAFSREVQG